MSMIRFSVVGDALTAPFQDGTYIDHEYSNTQRVGRLTSVANHDGRPDLLDGHFQSPLLDRHIERELLRVGTALSENQPVVVMINGFLFNPTDSVQKAKKDTDNPHKRLFGFADDYDEDTDIREHTSSLPFRLGFEEHDRGMKGLVIAFGWHSYPGFFRSFFQGAKNFYSAAYDNARDASWVLVALLDSLARNLPGRKIDLMCHSLGAAVTIRSQAIMAKHNMDSLAQMGRIIILGGSEYSGEANLMYRRLKSVSDTRGWDPNKDEGPIFYNIVSRENAILDILGENFGPKGLFTTSQVVGHNGLQARKKAPRWIDMQIDGGDFMEWARDAHGLTVSGDNPGTVWDHWYYYTYRSNLALYRNILRNRAAWSLRALRDDSAGKAVKEGVHVGFFGD